MRLLRKKRGQPRNTSKPAVGPGPRRRKSSTKVNDYRFELTDEQISAGEHRKTVSRAGLQREIPDAGLQDRLPASNLRKKFDFVLAQPVSTHLPLNHIRLCLYRVAQVTEPGARFFATCFEASPSWNGRRA